MKTFLISATMLILGCKKQFDHPPYEPAGEAAGISVAQLRTRFPGGYGIYRFGGGDTNLYCTVTADETSGNFYKQVFVRDAEGTGLELNLLESGGLYAGDEIRINLNGTILVYANGSLSLDSVDVAHIVKRSSGNRVTPKVVKIQDVVRYVNDPLNAGSLQSQLVEINGAEFSPEERGKCLGDVVSRSTVRRWITDCVGSRVQLSTSGFANFAGKPVPAGNGKIIALVTQYNNSMNLCLRNYDELRMENAACFATTPTTTPTFTFDLAAPVASLSEHFDNIASGSEFSQPGWLNFAETGSMKWKGSVKNSAYKALKASAYGAGGTCVTWLICPPVAYKPGMTLTFNSGAEYWDEGHADAIQAFASNDFNGQNFKSATWTPLHVSYADGSTGNYTGSAGVVPSGQFQLSTLPSFAGYSGSFCLAFRYAGDTKHDSNIYLDDIEIQSP
jgi:hypothetical protein